MATDHQSFAQAGRRGKNSQRGQDLAEYAILLGVIALAVILAVTLLGTNISGVFSSLASQVGAWW